MFDFRYCSSERRSTRWNGRDTVPFSWWYAYGDPHFSIFELVIVTMAVKVMAMIVERVAEYRSDHGVVRRFGAGSSCRWWCRGGWRGRCAGEDKVSIFMSSCLCGRLCCLICCGEVWLWSSSCFSISLFELFLVSGSCVGERSKQNKKQSNVDDSTHFSLFYFQCRCLLEIRNFAQSQWNDFLFTEWCAVIEYNRTFSFGKLKTVTPFFATTELFCNLAWKAKAFGEKLKLNWTNIKRHKWQETTNMVWYDDISKAFSF